MSRVGLDWYKREPVAYLGDVQGLTSKEHAVYAVVIDLLYVYGGAIRNDPKFIAGYISDMGSAAVRKALSSLDANNRITIEITDDEISQNRAKTEAKTKQNLRETAQKHGKIGGEKSAELRATCNENNTLVVADPSTGIQPEKTIVDKISKTEAKASTKKATRLPDDWFLPQQWGEWARDQGKGMRDEDIFFEADQFKDYWIGVGGQRGTKLNWEATWRNWIRRNTKGKNNGQRTNTPQGAERIDPALEQIARLTGI